MSSFLNRRKQFTTKEANHTHLITKLPWVIESGIFQLSESFFLKIVLFLRNAQIKQWKYFSQTIQISSLSFISNYLDIVSALIYAFASRPVSDIHAGSERAFHMLEAFNKSTDIQMRLSKIVTEQSEWIQYDAKMCPFLELDKDDLQNLCFGIEPSSAIRMLTVLFVGSYQVKQAISYIKDHLTPSIINDDELEFVVELRSKYDDLLRARFASRHSSSKNYIAIIQYNTKYTDHSINGWYCTCMIGW